MLRKLAVLLCLALLPSLASAEVIRYVAPGGTFTGGTITTPILAPAADNCASVPYSFTGDTNTGMCSSAADTVVLRAGGASRITVTDAVRFNGDLGFKGDTVQTYMVSATTGIVPLSFANYATPFVLAMDVPLVWTSSAHAALGTPDLFLWRDAANVFALRNGTAAQAFRVYNTYTDASNYEYGGVGWSSNYFNVGPTSAGTGSARGTVVWGYDLYLRGNGAGSTGIHVDTAGGVIFETSASPASGAACTTGTITWDASYIYVCTASGAWKRSALTGGY